MSAGWKHAPAIAANTHMAELTSEGFLKVPHASAPSAALPRVRSQSDVENDRVLALISRASASAPPALAIYLKQAAPAITLMWKFINLVAPLYAAMWVVCVRVYETLPVELLEALMGLGMCFAGGAYCTSIAAIEAFRLTGWHTTRRALQDVYVEAKNIQAAHAADDKKDDDHDGKPDVLALAPDELLQRKVKVFALAVRRGTRCHAHSMPTPRPLHAHSTPTPRHAASCPRRCHAQLVVVVCVGLCVVMRPAAPAHPVPSVARAMGVTGQGPG